MKKYIAVLIISFFIQCKKAPTISHWINFETSSSASFRGISAVSENVCWLSGSEGTVMLTLDGGKTWLNRSVPNMDTLQFRDIQAFNKDTAIILSAGLPAVVCKTTDGGLNWKTVYTNLDEGVFFDAMDFWDNNHGIAFSDAVKNKLLIIETFDGGNSWSAISESSSPIVSEKQGGFAASGTCLKTFGTSSVIIGLGGPEASVLVSADFGRSWKKTTAPLDFGEPSKGIFSFDFLDEKTGYCVGGDYRNDSLSTQSISKTIDGGLNWTLVNDTTINGKYRSCIKFVNENVLVAVSRTGTSYSINSGKNWVSLSGEFYSLSKGNDGSIWASGAKGKAARLAFSL